MSQRVETERVQVERREEVLAADDRRVIPRYLNFVDPKRIRSIVHRIERLPEAVVDRLWAQVLEKFASRHRDLIGAFDRHYSRVCRYMAGPVAASERRCRLIGAYFTCEYAIESAALFNPSIVPHPDQSGLQPGSIRFLMSLRATGEGHISSIVFRRGTIDAEGRIQFDPPPRYAHTALPEACSWMDRGAFLRKIVGAGIDQDQALPLLDCLPPVFTADQIQEAIDRLRQQATPSRTFSHAMKEVLWLAHANYELRFPIDCRPAEIVIFPATQNESHGMEDLRLVRFTEDDGRVAYHGVYTAADGRRIAPMLLRTEDFHHFSDRTRRLRAQRRVFLRCDRPSGPSDHSLRDGRFDHAIRVGIPGAAD